MVRNGHKNRNGAVDDKACVRVYHTKAAIYTMKRQTIIRFGWIIIFFLSLLPLLDLLHPGLPVTHDGQDHVARIANFYQSLSEGNLIPRWAANLNWGYGHPILMFLYPLPSYIASLFHFAGLSLVDSTKLVFAVAFVASMLAMYFWVNVAWGTLAAVVASILYGFAPYRFVDLYVRGAIGEHMAFVFLPLILWGLAKLKRDGRTVGPSLAIAFGTAALILSHNALSIMFIPIAVLYAVYLAWENRKIHWNFLFVSATHIGVGFLLSAFFWIPAFFEGKYTLRDIVTAGQFDGRFVPWSWFIYSPWSYGGSDMLSKSLGWAQLLSLAGLAIVFRKSGRLRVLFAGSFIILFGSLFVMTQQSQAVWQHITLLQKFQFPWRFLSISVFVAAVIGGLVAKVSGKLRFAFGTIVCGIAIIGTFNTWHAHAYKMYPTAFFTGIYHGTTDTGESSPIWSVRFMEHEASGSMSLIDGAAQIKPVSRTTTRHVYTVTAAKESRLVENTLYFPGWNITVDNAAVPIEFQDPLYRGLMTFHVPAGQHTVVAEFTDTKVRLAAAWISALTFVLFTVILGTMPLWQSKKRRYL